MKRNTSNIVKGIGIGMTVGAVVGIAGSKMIGSNKKLKKTASKALRSVTNAVSNMQSMMK
jgi:putative effector of murein hydrolase